MADFRSSWAALLHNYHIICPWMWVADFGPNSLSMLSAVDWPSSMSLPSIPKRATSAGLVVDLASTIKTRWRPLRPLMLRGCDQRRGKSMKAKIPEDAAQGYGYTQLNWSPYSEPVLSKRVKALSDALNIGTYYDVKAVKGQDLANAPFMVSTATKHCYTRQSVMKYFGVGEHPLTDMFLHHYTSKKHRPLWLFVYNGDADLRPVVKTVCVNRLREAVHKALKANGYGQWGDRLPGFDDTSVLHGTIHVRISHGKEFIQMSDQEIHDALDKLMKKHIIKQLQVPQWPMQAQSRRVRVGEQSAQNRGYSDQPQQRGSGQPSAGSYRNTRETAPTDMRAGNRVSEPRAKDGIIKGDGSSSRVQQLAERFRTRHQNPGSN
ncbi:hypothetical protein NEUTE1DRAFT_125191 [Neurospora tetrasperma FGSC 2508]|uniref:Uncharacterized protein n=1 Tax=Neurospora tetrasperma (strain FGSC 2508 / ATCC MYA-4615 / P0657) TaxID=510951 RepID=F8MY14_NEUT8|nr:uncharacterized protein NEUTE1DRAFT_125191 [Neurospora tetrasperma FGSC 2508]EGO51496.1 hypothetical protein NEUTE1DRAFT_125191 [Neurospora tetrasperma FGSC 2508]